MAQGRDSIHDSLHGPVKDVIRNNFKFLIEELDAKGVLDVLYQEDVLKFDDRQRIMAEQTDADMNRKLLDILKHKSSVQHLKFIEALRPMQDYVQKRLLEYTTLQNKSVSALLKDKDIRQKFMMMCASNFLHEATGERVSVKDICGLFEGELRKCGFDKSSQCLTSKELIEAIKTQFPNAEEDMWEKQRKGSKKRTRKLIDRDYCLINVQLITEDKTANETSVEIAEETSDEDMDPKQRVKSHTESCHKRTLRSWDSKQVAQYLSTLQIDQSIPETFDYQEISGDVFECITKQEIKEICPNAKFGHVKKILSARDKALQGLHEPTCMGTEEFGIAKTKRQYETRRKFDSPVKPSTKYKKGFYLQDPNTLLGNPLEPIEMYCFLKGKEDKLFHQFQKITTEFICACMNERTNGTIYFGVDKDGQIIGQNGNFDKWNTALQGAIDKIFYADEREHVHKSIRPLRLIEVIQKERNDSDSEAYVVELDIIPSHSICEENAYFIKKSITETREETSMSCGDAHIIRYNDGKLELISGEKLINFMKLKSKLANNRKQKEEEYNNKSALDTSHLGQKLKRLLCRGEESMDGDIFPILVMNSIPRDYTDKETSKQFQFLKDLPWKAVFDFDNKANLFTYLEDDENQVMKIILAEDFDQDYHENLENPDRLSTLIQDLKICSHRPWIFSNGYDDQDSVSVVKWKQMRSTGFKEAVRFMDNEIPKGRAMVVFMLFSKDYDVMLEAADELAQRFGNQWFTLAESDEVAVNWQEELCRRHLVENVNDLEEMSVIGIPWNHVNDTIQSILGAVKESTCELPTSNGSFVKLSDKIKNDWIDLEILSAKECKMEADNATDHQLQQNSEQREAQFYQGGEVDWWNFYFKQHVLERHCFSSLRNCVHDVLRGRYSKEDRAECIYLYHQPGAGGTTTAKQVLWDLKEEYRCAIVKKITSHTSDQIMKLHIYEDECNPKPVLLLFDNMDEERTTELRAELEEKAKQISRNNLDNPCSVFYVFLLCNRHTVLPHQRSNSLYFVLKHELNPTEQQWFREKYEELKFNFERNAKKGVNPKHLISFNIMKENFSAEYIARTVSELVSEICDDREKKLLKYVSLLNAYDISFQSIPTSAFNKIMEEKKKFWHKVDRRWELHLSQPLKILLSQINRKKPGEGMHIRIIHNTLSEKIFVELISTSEETNAKLSLSDEVLDFLESNIFCYTYSDNAVEYLLKIIRDVVKKRSRNPHNGKPETKFAPLIEKIKSDPKQGVEQAAVVLEKVYHLSGDVFVGQQLARLYIHSCNWEQAQKYANEITKKKSDNSYLWDTYGHSFREQIKEKYKECIEQNSVLTPNQAIHILDLAFQAIRIFQKEQEVSEVEKSPYVNDTGYFQELATVTSLYDCLSLVDGLQDNALHDVLVKYKSLPLGLQHVFGESRITALFQIQHNVNRAMARLEDEHLQLRDDMIDEYRKSNLRFGKEMLIKYKENLENYYGEEHNDVPPNLSDEEACKYRRRRLFRLASGNTFRAVFELRKKEDGENVLLDIRRLVQNNMDTEFCDMFDFQTFISTCLTLCCIDEKYKDQIKRENLAEMSKTLYEKSDQRANNLEPYLFAAMFNWPQQSSNTRFPIQAREIPEIMRAWRQAYYNKYPRQREEGRPGKKKETTMFFLGNGSGMHGFAFDRELRLGGRYNRNNEYFWRASHVLQRLERWTGILKHDGREVKLLITLCGDKLSLTIPTSFPIMNRAWWNKKVYLVIGFTWAGPKAFDINIEDPRNRPLDQNTYGKMTFTNSQHNPTPVRKAEWVRYNNNRHFLKEKYRIEKELNEIDKIKRKPPQHRKQFEKKQCARERELHQRLETIKRYRVQNLNEFYTDY